MSKTGRHDVDGVLFLDIDGVLCTQRCHYAAKATGIWNAFDPVGIQFVKNLCDDFQLRIVASTTWRYFGDDHINIKTILGSHGLCQTYFWKKWKTKDFRATVGGNKRGQEINDWLKSKPHVSRFIILDDNSYDFMQEGLSTRHIATHPDDGITSQNYIDARHKLQGMK